MKQDSAALDHHLHTWDTHARTWWSGKAHGNGLTCPPQTPPGRPDRSGATPATALGTTRGAPPETSLAAAPATLFKKKKQSTTRGSGGRQAGTAKSGDKGLANVTPPPCHPPTFGGEHERQRERERETTRPGWARSRVHSETDRREGGRGERKRQLLKHTNTNHVAAWGRQEEENAGREEEQPKKEGRGRNDGAYHDLFICLDRRCCRQQKGITTDLPPPTERISR